MSFRNPPTWKSTLAATVGGVVLAFVLAYSRSPTLAVANDGNIYLNCDELCESSGLAVSTRSNNVVWSHNDSGDTARVFAFDLRGQHLAQVTLPGITAVDWEDMCAFELDGEHYVAVADVGDNFSRRKSVDVHIFKEPDLSSRVSQLAVATNSTSKSTGPSQPVVLEIKTPITFEITYAEGATDCEAIAYNPLRRQLQLFSKEMIQSRVYNIPLDRMVSSAMTLAAEQLLETGIVTGADISRDGQSLALVSYGPYWITKLDSDGKWNVRNIPVFDAPERRQGESICFSSDGANLLFSSEHAPTPLLQCAAPQADSIRQNATTENPSYTD